MDMKSDYMLRRFLVIAVVVATAGLFSPGPASAKLYWTNTGTVTATAASQTQINVAAPYSTGTTSCGNGADGGAQFYCEWATDTGFTTNYGRYPTSGYEVDPNTDQNSTWEYSITGLSCGTNYYVRVIYSDADGVNSCSGADVPVNASTWPVSTNACPAADTTVGTVTSPAQTSTSITLTATLTGDGNNDGYCEFYYNTTNNFATATLSSACNHVTGASAGANRTCEITGLNSSTPYYLWAKYIDPDGVNGGPQVAVTGAPISTQASNGTTTGTVTTSAQTDTSITITATLTGDANNNGSCNFYYNTANNFGTATLSSSCTGVTGASAGADRTCTITGLLPGTMYYIWSDYIDTDGVDATPVQLTGASTSTTYTGLGVGTVTTGTVADTSVVVNAPVDSANSDTNSDATVQYQYYETGVGPWTNFGSAVAAKTNQSMTITGLTGGTQYDFRVVWTDADGVYDMSTRASLGSPYTSNTASATTSSGPVCVSTITSCSDCHGMPPVDWDGVGPKTGTTGSQGDHGIAAHTGLGTRDKCAVCHYDYARMINVTSTARWTFTHTNSVLDIYTSNHVPNNIFATPYDKGIKGGYYKGYRGNSLIFDDNTPGANNVCTATYCHGAGDSPIWGTGTAACGSCHAIPPTTGRHATHNNGYVGYKNNSNSTTYNFGCYKCHSDTANHASGPVNPTRAALVNFDNFSTPQNSSGVYAQGSLAGTDGTFNWTDGSCTQLYCHSNGAGVNVNNPTWNSTPGTTCTGCHYNDKAATPYIMATGKHTAHVNNTDANLAAFGCVKCHSATVSDDRTISDKTMHVNGTPNVVFDSLNPAASYSSPDCSNVYCHSSGQATPTYRAVSWSTGTITTCNTCHGADNYYVDVNGSPDYQNISTADRNSFNGHYVSGHVSSASDCIKCHNATVDSSGNIKAGSAHLDGTRTVSFALGGSYSNKRCSGTDSTSCHGSTTPRWGGTLRCEDCHFNTGAIGSETDDYTYNNGTRATINQTEWTTEGHGKTNGNYYWTQQPAANLSCTDCHDYNVKHGMSSNPFRLISSATIRPTDNSTLCLSCHNGTTAVAAAHHNDTNIAAVYPSANATWTFTPKCVDCHDPHGDTAGGVTPAEYNGAMIQSKVAITGSNAYGVPNSTTNMDFPYDDPATGSDFDYGSFQNAGFTGLCQVCHDASDNVDNFNKTTDNTSHYTNQNKCTGCHKHTDGFGPSGGTCTGCHASSQNGRASMQTEFSKTSHHINAAWASIDATDCEVCHLEGGNTADGSPDPTYHNNNVGGAYPVDLRKIVTVGASETATITNSSNQTAIQFYTGHGSHGGTKSAGNVANRFCGGCHNDTNASTHPFAASEGTGAGTSPGTYDPSGAGSVFRRYSSATTVKSHKYSPSTYNVVGQLNKAFSPHGHPEKNQMNNVVSGTWTDDTQTVSNAVGCLDCHNSHGSNALTDDGTNFSQNGITYSSAVGGYKGAILKTYSTTYDPDETTTYSAVSDLCFDCHLGDGGSSVPKIYSNFGVARAIKNYFDAGRWTTSDSVSSSFSYKQGSSAANGGKIKGGHFGASDTMRTTTTGSINGSCLACHDPHGTPYTNLVGSTYDRNYMVPALKGTWMASPYKEDRAPISVNAQDTNIYSIAVDRLKSARVSPDFPLNNPPTVGDGFGSGNSSFGTYGAGGSGNDGYFIDDNTFGIKGVTDTTADDNSIRMTNISSHHITETDAQFGGLCLGCHPKANIDTEVSRTAVETGNVAINVHRTVKGWDNVSAPADFFTPALTNEHSMAYVETNPTTSSVCSSAYWRLPGGYRWSVDPGTGIQITGSGSWNAQTLPGISDHGGQTHPGFTQPRFHQFPCSKCHAPHATKLPKLLKTNCLDVGTSATAPKHASGYTYQECDQSPATITLKPMTCHNFQKSNTSGGGGWNIRTGW
jgi:predicted CxxxxCH...CXXCH cytochrome family protein